MDRRKPWGTVQAVLAAEAELAGPFAVVNADDFYGAESYAALNRFLVDSGRGRRQAAVGFRVAETLADGGPVARALLELDEAGELGKIVEIPRVWRQGERILYLDGAGREREMQGDELVSMNMWGFTPEVLPHLRRSFAEFLRHRGQRPDSEFLLPDMVQSMICGGQVCVEVLRGRGVWCGITFRQDQQRVRSVIASLVEQGGYPEELWK